MWEDSCSGFRSNPNKILIEHRGNSFQTVLQFDGRDGGMFVSTLVEGTKKQAATAGLMDLKSRRPGGKADLITEFRCYFTESI